MTRPDDSTLDPADLLAVEERARSILDRANAWHRFPIPVDDVLAAAEVRLAPTNAFNPVALLSYLKVKASGTGARIKSAISKVLGLYDAAEGVIHIDTTVAQSKQTFLKLHETGHHDIPTHRKMYRFFQDCRETLDPAIADQFEREANNFARFVLFKGSAFAEHAADCPFEIKTPIKLARKFGASIYASAREFARTNLTACAVFALEPIERIDGIGLRAPVRRVEASPRFLAQFGPPTVQPVTPSHFLWPAIPIARKMTRPVSLMIRDINGQRHECIAEGFDTTHNILVLLYPIRALSSKMMVVPSSASAIHPTRTKPAQHKRARDNPAS